MITQNPYQVSRPITDPDDLFGRKTEFDLIYQMLLSGESVNIMGPPQNREIVIFENAAPTVNSTTSP